MSTTSPLPQKLDWMICAGVGAEDIDWLAQKSTARELHLPAHRRRVEEIYTKALSGVLDSDTRLDLMLKIVEH